MDKFDSMSDDTYLEYQKNDVVSECHTDESYCQDKIACKVCFNKCERADAYVILSCNHVFHIRCLAETHFNDTYKFHVIDSEYIESRRCLVCEKPLETEEILFLHSKFLNSTKSHLEMHQSKIKNLEHKFQMLKDEIKSCYEYKNKLDYDREKSKQIVNSLMTLI
jgi:hypothetical protein